MRLLLLCCACLISGPVAAEIYRWVDANGLVHFGERPMTDDAHRIEVPSQDREPQAAAPNEAARRARQRRLLEAFEYEREREAEQEARAAQRASRRAERCDQARQYWRRLNHPGPIYEVDDQGRRRYLDEAERKAEQDRVRPMYREVCGESPE